MDIDKTATELKNYYVSLQLKNIYKLYFSKFDTADKKNIINALSDGYITKLIVKVFSNESLFLKFFNQLPKDVKDIMYYLIWEGNEISQTDLKKDFQIDISSISYKTSFNPFDYIEKIQEKYHIFSIEKYYDPIRSVTLVNLSLCSTIKKLVRPFFKQKPLGYDLNNILDLKDTDFSYENSYKIINDINYYFKLLENKKDFLEPEFFDNIKINKSDFKFLSEVVKDKNDFFDSKDQLKKTILLNISNYYYKFYKENKLNNIAILKDIILKLETNPFLLSYNLLSNLGGKNSIKSFHSSIAVKNRTFFKSIFFVLKNLKQDNWYSIKDIIKFINLRDLDVDIFYKLNIENLYLNYTNEYNKKDKKHFSKKNDYNDLFVVQNIKSTFFLFSALGLLDIKYNNQSNELDSFFSGLSYIKLNKLGSYLLGLSDSFEFTVTETKKTKLIFEEEYLTIKLTSKDNEKEVYLDSFAERVSNNLFMVTNKSFLKNCTSKKDIEEKIKLFKKEFNNEPTKIWDDFFYSVINKFIPLEIENDLVVYKVPNNKELIDILFKDEIIKHLILKVEGQRIAISKENISKVKKRLESFGFSI